MSKEAQTQMISLAQRFAQKALAIEPGKLEALLAVQPDVQKLAQLWDEEDEQEEKPYQVTSGGVAVIDVSGVLIGGKIGFWLHLFGYEGYENISEIFEKAKQDSRVKGILLNVNSPGGEAAGMFEVSDLIYQARGGKPIYAIANEEAFSAAYGIASAADRIYVSRLSGVGSVGVIAAHLEISKYNEQIGKTWTLVRAGKYKAEGNPLEPLTQHAKDSIQGEVDRIYALFVSLVARNRGMTAEEIRRTEAGLYFGENALAVRFADHVRTFKEALQELEDEVNKPGKGNSIMSANTQPTPEQNAPAPAAQNPTPAPVASAPTPTPAPQPQPTPSEARGQSQAQMDAATEIVEICAIAGMTAVQASEYIKAGKSPAQVRTEIINSRAAAGDANPINNHVEPKKPAAKEEEMPSTAQLYAERNKIAV